MSQIPSTTLSILDDIDQLISLLPDLDTVDSSTVKNLLRSRCPQFAELASKDSHKLSRRICHTLESQGKTWSRIPQPGLAKPAQTSLDDATSRTEQLQAKPGDPTQTEITSHDQMTNARKRTAIVALTQSNAKKIRPQSEIDLICQELDMDPDTVRDILLKRPSSLYRSLEMRTTIQKQSSSQFAVPYVGYERIIQRKVAKDARPSTDHTPTDPLQLLITDSRFKFRSMSARNAGFQIHAAESYTMGGASAHSAVADSMRVMAENCIKFDHDRFRQDMASELRTNLQYCQAVICRTMVQSDMSVCSVLPVNIPCPREIKDFALRMYSLPAVAITTHKGEHYLLPLEIWAHGDLMYLSSTRQAIHRYVANCSGWTLVREAKPRQQSLDLPILDAHIMEKFREQPVVSFADSFDILAPNSQILPREWARRRLSHFIGVRWNRAVSTELGPGWVFFPPCHELFTDVSLLMSVLLQTCHPVKWQHEPPSVPFQEVLLADFEFVIKDDMGERRSLSPKWHQWAASMGMDDPMKFEADFMTHHGCLINGNAACRFCFTCTEPAINGSWYCVTHAKSMIQYANHSSDMEVIVPKVADLTLIHQDPSAWDEFIRLMRRFRDHPETTWIVDFEFVTLSQGRSCVPTEVAIRDVNRRSIVNVQVDYDMDSNLLYDTIKPYLLADKGAALGNRHAARIQRGLKRYNDLNYLPISKIRDLIIDHGYDPATHKIMSWWTSHDSMLFNRILESPDEPVVPASKPIPQENLGMFIKTAAGLSCAKLGFAHGSLITGPARQFHLADEDVSAMLDLIDLLRRLCASYSPLKGEAF